MLKILVVEDEALVADDIQRTLVELGYEVPKPASTGREALRAVEQSHPDLVLMDIKLKGGMDGIDAARRVHASDRVPVVYLTSHSDEATLARAKETEPYGYLLKPFTDQELRTAIEVAIRRHKMEALLEERERWFSTTLQSIGDAVIATDPNEVITFMNGVAERLTGWKREEAIGKKLGEVFEILNSDGSPIESPVRRALRESFTVSLGNTDLARHGGGHIAIDDSASPIIDDKGNVLGGVIVFRDVTERKKLEQRLSQSERLASIGTMAAGMAHEINNPLAVVIGNADFAASTLAALRADLGAVPGAQHLMPRMQEVSEALYDATQAADRVRRIVQDLKRFARADEIDKKVLDLPDVLDAAVKMSENHIRHSAILIKKYGTTPFVEANEGRLVQVFTNLLVNAAQASDEAKATSNEIRVVTSIDDAGRAVVEIQDSGCGIAKTDLDHIFEPFFSTKQPGNGTGLGLTICHNIITSLGGEISADSELGKGTVFRIAIPPASRPSEPPPEASKESKPIRRGRILVVDDDIAVGRTVERVLKEDHDVFVETDGRVALSRIARGERFDVIFCDMMMPTMAGFEVYQAIDAVHPEIAQRIVFLTGGAFSERATKFLNGVANLTVAKPFSSSSLRSIAGDYVK